MTRLKWNAVGERTFELGVDRGVLYVGANPGVPWNGLISVKEEPNGGTSAGYYLDGKKYLNALSIEEFEATIEAYTYPEIFSECDGTSAMGNGLYATQQEHQPFSLVYRSLVGNDVKGTDFAYKIHLVYNALVSPTARNHATVTSSAEPDNFSWKVTTSPVIHSVMGPVSHLVVDSRKTDPDLMKDIEDLLYGNATINPQLLDVDDVYNMFKSFVPSTAGGYDAGRPWTTADTTYDGGTLVPVTTQTLTLDGGAP